MKSRKKRKLLQIERRELAKDRYLLGSVHRRLIRLKFSKIDPLYKSLFFIIIATLAFTFVSASAKILTGDGVPLMEVAFTRTFIAILFILVSFKISKPTKKGGKPYLLMTRGIVGAAAFFCYFYTLATIPLGTAATLNKTSSFIIPIISYFFFSEKTSRIIWISIFIGFLGMLFVAQPSPEVPTVSIIIGLLNGLFVAIASSTIKEAQKYYDARMLILSFCFFGMLMSVVFLGASYYIPENSLDTEFLQIVFAKPKLPHEENIVYMLALGLFTAIAQAANTKSFLGIKNSTRGALGYISIPISIILGVSLGDKMPDIKGLLGTAIIIFAGLLIAKSKDR